MNARENQSTNGKSRENQRDNQGMANLGKLLTKTANRFEISSLLEKILLKQVKWCLTLVGLYIKMTFD
jgi:hypothetical protein